MLKRMKKNQKGFTLVELVVVIAILAVLSALLVPRIMGNVQDAAREREIADARTLASEIAVYNAKAKAADDPVGMPSYLTSPATNDTLPAELKYADDADFPDATIVQINIDADGNATIEEQP
jgi:type IV pilus assembly protein PilA